MVGIILEGVLFVALIATIATLLFFAVYYLTPLGLRLKQSRNRRVLEHELELNAPSTGCRGRGDGAPAVRHPHLSGML